MLSEACGQKQASLKFKERNTMKKILFIGNSYTFFNDMPELFKALAKENGHEAEVISVTKGGRFLWQNIDLDDEFSHSVAKAFEDEYDVAILQDQSLVAVDSPENFFRGIKSHFDRLRSKRVLLYATWGRKAGSDKLTERNITSMEMYEKLDCEYTRVADALGAELSNVGKAFKHVYTNFPEIDVYKPDLSHPSYLGSCLAAMVHYKTVYGEPPKTAGSLNLDEKTEKTFFDAISK